MGFGVTLVYMPAPKPAKKPAKRTTTTTTQRSAPATPARAEVIVLSQDALKALASARELIAREAAELAPDAMGAYRTLLRVAKPPRNAQSKLSAAREVVQLILHPMIDDALARGGSGAAGASTEVRGQFIEARASTVDELAVLSERARQWRIALRAENG